MTGTNSTHQYPRNTSVDSAYLPLAKQLCAGSHSTRLFALGIVSLFPYKVPSPNSISTSVDIRAALRADYLQTQLTQSADEIVEHRIFQNDARIIKPLCCSLTIHVVLVLLLMTYDTTIRSIPWVFAICLCVPRTRLLPCDKRLIIIEGNW